MERGSVKHSPRIDEELDHETSSLRQSGQFESRSDPALVQEGLLPDEQPPAGPPSAHEPPSPGQPDDAAIELRSALARSLEPHVFPASARELVDVAVERGAPDRIIDLLRSLDPDGAFANVEGIWEELGMPYERRA